ncbi:MAG TPA: bifunctional riboflavin kinase/FAD synthetase [Gammaproteobacteria bacterium]|nr:bifunctional riboflavin kinase/FAD synthetase [Gammaproteobacteria bacterium]
MKLIRGLYNLRAEHQGSAATIGNFDGAHLGHQAVLGQLREYARSANSPTTVITFEPLPQEYFLKAKAPGRLTPLRRKFELLRDLGIGQMLCLPFNDQLANMTAETFIQRVLVDGLAVRLLVVGDDFRFGRNRAGDFALLRQAGEQFGFEVVDTRTHVCSDGERVSSTRIRQALAEGDFAMAEKLLGRPFTMSGHVIHGDKRGRQIGFPTLNIRANRPVSPLKGVFAVRVDGLGNGVANVGTRPTFDGKSMLAEIHLLDFDGDLYGRRITVRFLKKLRAEKKFDDFQALVAQINQDIEAARRFFDGGSGENEIGQSPA